MNIIEVSTPLRLQNLQIKAFEGVDKNQLDKLFLLDRMRALFKFLDELVSSYNHNHYIMPDHWLISSIDNLPKGQPRFKQEHGNHYQSRAVDIVPLTKNDKINMHPLNRNVFLHDVFVNKFSKSKYHVRLPLIVFESDHIHVDVNHNPGIYRLRKFIPYFDGHVFRALSSLPEPLRSQMLKYAMIKLA